MPPAAIGPYLVQRELGRGGMGEVYLAHDPRLDRSVAIKALPAHLAQDPDRLARFQREAKALAALNHPGVGAIYGVEEAAGHQYLILEFVEGETLAERLGRGPVPLDEALAIARQIAEALEAAHEKGIVHRDLKPGNVMVTADGVVKVLDFGLARTADGPPTSGNVAALAASPTVTSPVQHSPTVPGVIMGTAGYMSPEQARGKPVDKRSDIFSFGCVLFELLTGTMPFRGETVADSIGATLHQELDLARLPAGTPPAIRLLLARCLAKDRTLRLRDMGDARLEIAQALSDPSGRRLGLALGLDHAAGPRRPLAGRVLPWLVAAIALLVAGFLFWSRPGRGTSATTSSASRVLRFTIEPPAGYVLPEFTDYGSSFAIDPAGRQIVYIAKADGKPNLCSRDLAGGETTVLPHTEGASSPFFSPDGAWLAYNVDDRLMKMPAKGGPALTVCEAPSNSSYSWLDDGTIAWTGGASGLWKVNATGGAPVVVARAGQEERTVEGDLKVLGFDSPLAVPGASYLLATVWDGGSTEDYHLVRVDMANGGVHTVLRSVTAPNLIAPDRLLFTRGPTVMTVAFDPVHGKVLGEPTVALDGVRCDMWTDSAYMGASVGGTFAYVPGRRQVEGRRPIRVDLTGKTVPLLDEGDFVSLPPVVSPDGKRIVFSTLRNRIEVWVLDLERHAKTRLTSLGENYNPTWSADGKSIVTRLDVPDKPPSLVRWPASGGDPVPLPDSCPEEQNVRPIAALPDGSGLIVGRTTRANADQWDLGVYRFADKSILPLRERPANQRQASVAPNGAWMAFTSDESGRKEVYLGPLDAPGPNVQITLDGGQFPRVARDGKQVFFVDRGDNLSVVDVETSGSELRASPPRKLFNVRTVGVAITEWSCFDLFPNGDFAMLEKAVWEKEPPVIHVIVHWADELAAASEARTAR